MRLRLWFFLGLGLLFSLAFCGRKEEKDKGTVTLVFKYGRIMGDPQAFSRILRRFEAENPGIKVVEEALPSSTDEQHQYYVVNLGSRAADFDVFSLDVIWVPEFAAAGWLRELSHLLPAELREDFFSGPLEAASYKGRIYAIPWYIDAGLLYFRADLLQRYGFSPPKTWTELVDTAEAITAAEPGMYGFVWQGKQYEGLVCNALEYMWSNGGAVLEAGRVAVNSPENVAALQFMRDLVAKYKVSPELVTTTTEEDTRRIFGRGKAVFMRNWPYAWTLLQQADSPVKDKVGVCPLPAFSGHRPASTLGGWFLGVSRFSRHPRAAERLVQFLTSLDTARELAFSFGYSPVRKRLYQEAEFRIKQPYLAILYDVFLYARPRPVSPYYMQITQVLQPELSAVLAGTKSPEEALESAQRQIERIVRQGGMRPL